MHSPSWSVANPNVVHSQQVIPTHAVGCFQYPSFSIGQLSQWAWISGHFGPSCVRMKIRQWRKNCKQKWAKIIKAENWVNKEGGITLEVAGAVNQNPTINLRLCILGYTIDFESKYKQKQGKIWVWTETTWPTTGSETFLDILEDLLSRQIDKNRKTEEPHGHSSHCEVAQSCPTLCYSHGL